MSVYESLVFSAKKKVKIVYQSEISECGLACVTMISNYHGNCVQLNEMRGKYGSSNQGVSLRHLIEVAAAEKLGSRALSVSLPELRKLSMPCILHWKFNHFVVLQSVTEKGAVICDPVKGVERLPIKLLSKSFTGVALELWPKLDFQRVSRRERLSLKHLKASFIGLGGSLTQILIISFVLELLMIISPLYFQWLIDHIILNDDNEFLPTLAGAFIFLLLIQQALKFAREWMVMYLSTLAGVQWRSNVLDHLMRLPISFFQNRSLGDLISKFGSVNAIQQTLTSGFLVSILDGVMALVTIVMMFYYSAGLALVSVAAASAHCALRFFWFAPLKTATAQHIACATRQETNLIESLRGIRTLKAFGRQGDRHSSWVALYVRQVNAGTKSHRLNLCYQQATGLIGGLEHIIALWIGAEMVMAGFFSIGVLTAYNSYRVQFGARLVSLIDKVLELCVMRLEVERLSDIVLSEPDSVQLSCAEPSGFKFDLLELRDLSYRYDSSSPWILRNLNLTIKAGDFLAITGSSGSGKSTLLNILLGLLRPTEGHVLLNGIDVTNGLSLQKISSCVFQDDVLFAGSLFENITFFDPSFDEEKVVDAAKFAAIHEDIIKLPMGYQTLVGDMGVALSGGQRQRVMLARAFYKQPSILFLDEATSHLDIANEFLVNEALSLSHITKVMVAHRPQAIAAANRVVILEEGAIKHNFKA